MTYDDLNKLGKEVLIAKVIELETELRIINKQLVTITEERNILFKAQTEVELKPKTIELAKPIPQQQQFRNLPPLPPKPIAQMHPNLM